MQLQPVWHPQLGFGKYCTWQWRRHWRPTPVLLPGKSHGQRNLAGCSPWRRHWRPTPVLLPGKAHGQRNLAGCSPWGSDMTERLHFHFSLAFIGERNGNPLQCSCLENPRDGGAWWAAVCGVAQSRTRLKQLSSSSSTWQWASQVALVVRTHLPMQAI